jgi:hypothetical protein
MTRITWLPPANLEPHANDRFGRVKVVGTPVGVALGQPVNEHRCGTGQTEGPTPYGVGPRACGNGVTGFVSRCPQGPRSGADVGREVLAGEGGAGGDEIGRCALEDDPATVVAGPGAEVDDPVGVCHDRLVVRDDDDRLA